MDATRYEKRDIAQDGWGGFESYMKRKEEKQASQFKRDSSKYKTVTSSSSIFQGVSIYVNGYTDPPAEKLKRIMMMHGGRYIYYPNKSNTTHVVATNLAYTKIKELKNEKVVTPAWITDSVEAGKLLPHAPYLLYRPTASNQSLHRFSKAGSKQSQGMVARGTIEIDRSREMAGDTHAHKSSEVTNEAVSGQRQESERRKLPIGRETVCRTNKQKPNNMIGQRGVENPEAKPRKRTEQTQIKDDPETIGGPMATSDRNKLRTQTFYPGLQGESHVSKKAGMANENQDQNRQSIKGKEELEKTRGDIRRETEEIQGGQKLPTRIFSQFNKAKTATESEMAAVPTKEHRDKDVAERKRKLQEKEGYSPCEVKVNEGSQGNSDRDREEDKRESTGNTKKQRKGSYSPPSTDDLSSDGIAKCLKLKDSQSNWTYFPKATDPNFLPTFYRHSSFYHLTTWRAEHRLFVKELKANHDGIHPGKERLVEMYGHRRKQTSDITKKDVSLPSVGPGEGGQDGADWHSEEDAMEKNRVIMHIDMDAFFVAVSLLNYPELRGKPVAVAHYAAKAQKRLFTEADQRESQENVSTQVTNCETSSSGCSGSKSSDNSTERDTESSTVLGPRKDANEIEEDDDDEVFLPSPTRVVASESENFSSLAAIASCSYEARVYGVRNGMIMKLAKELCPDLRTIPYDFDGYYRVSRLLYKVVASYTHDLQATSCDEVLMDVTDLMEETGATGVEIAEAMRKEIFERTKCSASAGLAPNVILARLCTKAAKPDGVFVLPEDGIWDFLKNAPVGDLPGIGRAFTKKMHAMGVYTCADLQRMPLKTIQKEFGPKTGEMLYQNCRGHDTKPMRSERERKYVSVEVNYGIRFDEEDDAHQFILRLSREVQRKLQRLSLVGRTITLKLKVRRAGTPVEDVKFMGYGVFDNKIKTVSLSQETDNSGTIYRACKGLLVQLAVVARDIRGVGIQISKLKRPSSLKGMSKPITDLLPKKEDLPTRTEPIRPPSEKRGERRYSLLDFVSPKKSKVATPSPTSKTMPEGEGRPPPWIPTRDEEDAHCMQRQHEVKLSHRKETDDGGKVNRPSSMPPASEVDCLSSPVRLRSQGDSAGYSGNVTKRHPRTTKTTHYHGKLTDTTPSRNMARRCESQKMREVHSQDEPIPNHTKGKRTVRKSLEFGGRCGESSPRERDSSSTISPKSSIEVENRHCDNNETRGTVNLHETDIHGKDRAGGSPRGGKCHRRQGEREETIGIQGNPITTVAGSTGKDVVPTPKTVRVSLDRTEDDLSIHPSQVDVSVLKSLPGDIRDQVISQYNLSFDSGLFNRFDPNQPSTSAGVTSGLDQDVLQNLPPDLLQEVLEAEGLKTKETENQDGLQPRQQKNTKTDGYPIKPGNRKVSNGQSSISTVGTSEGGNIATNSSNEKAARNREIQNKNTSNVHSDNGTNLPGKRDGNASEKSPTSCKLSNHQSPVSTDHRGKSCRGDSPGTKKKVFKITNYLLSKKQKNDSAVVTPSRGESRLTDSSPTRSKLSNAENDTKGASSVRVQASRVKGGRAEIVTEDPVTIRKLATGREIAATSPTMPDIQNTTCDSAREVNRSDEPSRICKKAEISLGGASTIEGVKATLKQWVQLFEIPLDEDISHVVHFLRSLILDRNLAMVYQLLRALKRIVTNQGRKEWMDAYVIITERVQTTVGHIYGGSLKLD